MSSKNCLSTGWSVARSQKNDASILMAKTIGAQIRKLRHKAGYSQERLADDLGVHRTQIGFVERGENTTSIYTLALIAKRLGIKASELLRMVGY